MVAIEASAGIVRPVDFYKIFTSPLDHAELKRELWTANVVYMFSPAGCNRCCPSTRSGDHHLLPEDKAFQQ